MKHVKIVLAFAMAFAALAANAQTEQPYSWKVAPQERTVHPGDIVHVSATATIKDNWHIYSTKTYGDEGPIPTQFGIRNPNVFKIDGKITSPKPQTKHDEAFEITAEFFEKSVTFTIPVRVNANAAAGKQNIAFSITAMACNDRMCMPPKTTDVSIPIVIAPAAANTGSAAPPAGAQPAAPAQTAPSGSPAQAAATDANQTGAQAPEQKAGNVSAATANGAIGKFQTKGLWWFMGFAFSMGLLALLTPCVFPMIPLTVSFFTKRGATKRSEAIREAGLYGMGIVGTYTAAGFLFALIFGASSITNIATSPSVNVVFGGIFLLLALNLFGVYEIAIPARIVNSLNIAAGNGKNVGSLMLMGLMFTFTSFTCTVPFIGTVMVAAARGQFLWPLAGMLSFSAAFALPFVILAMFPHALHRLPKSGDWMNRVKIVMGFLELAAVVKFISNADIVWQWKIITRDVFLSSWMAIALILTAYLLGFFRMKGENEAPQVGAGRLLLSVFFLVITLFFYTGINGIPLGTIDAYLPPRDYGADVRITTAGFPETAAQSEQTAADRANGRAQSSHSEPEYTWHSDYTQALALARAQKKNVFIDFTGFTCTNCRWMESNVFPKPMVDSLLRQYILVKLYTDGNGDEYRQNQNFEESRFGTIALPLYAVMSPDDQQVAVFAQGMTRDVGEFASFLKSGLPADIAER